MSALAARIGIPAVAGSQRRCRMSSAPSRTGIIRSVTTRSGGESRTEASAAAPSAAWDTSCPARSKILPEHEPLVRLVIDYQNPGHPQWPPLTTWRNDLDIGRAHV